MNYKITAEQSITLLLDGKFSEDALPALQQSISEARERQQTIYVDLSEVTLIDRKAVEYFSEQASKNVRFVNCPVYLRSWIRQVSDEFEKQ